MHSAAIRIRSAFMPSRMWENPIPSVPTRASPSITTSSKNTSVVLWFIIVGMGLMVSPGTNSPSGSRNSSMNTDSPDVRSPDWPGTEVRASRIIRSECSALDVQIFWPLTRHVSPSRSARVRMAVVSDPADGSVTPNAWRRSRPSAIRGR